MGEKKILSASKWMTTITSMMAMTPQPETLVAEPVFQLPNAQRGIHKAFGPGKAIVALNLAVINFLFPCLLHGTGPVFSGRSRPSPKTPP
jgi:hypothetical protein